jgi:exodeoxyribonuclease VII large subunit
MSFDDLPLFQASQSAPKPLSISELTQKIRGTLEPAFSSVLVVGEVSNYRPAASGHLYFSLKDSGAMISTALFSFGGKKRLPFELKDGLQVLCKGKVSVYGPRGSYQLVLDSIEPIGAGALQYAFEQLKEKLLKEGLFDRDRKKPIPAFPKKVAIITSPTGAAIQDMLNVLRRRAPQIEVLVIPALVQGTEAPSQIINGIRVVVRHQLADLIVLARGGGSLEDLWAFNDEALAREIVNSPIPTISAVGHEVDFTIADFVADLRAPTPSAAAEMFSQNWVECRRQVATAFERIKNFLMRELSTRQSLLRLLASQLVSPKDKLRDQMQKCDEWAHRLEMAMRNGLERRQLAFGRIIGKLEALSPLRVLERGYSIVRSPSGKVLKSKDDVKPQDELKVSLHDGEIQVRVF